MKPETKGHIALWASSPLWGSTFIAGEIAVSQMPAVTHAYFRVVLASLLFGLLLAIRKIIGGADRTTPLWKLCLTGTFGIAIFHLFHAFQLKLSNATQTAVLIGLLPISLTLLGRFFLQESLTIAKLIGTLLAITGMIVVIDPSIEELTHWSKPWQLLGASLGSALSYAFCTILMKRWNFKDHPVDICGWGTICGAVCLGPLLWSGGFLDASVVNQITQLNLFGWAANIYLSFVGSVAAYCLYIYAIKRVPAGDSGQFIFVEPVWAAIFSYFVFGRVLSLQTLVGGLLLFVGVALTLYFEAVLRLARRLRNSSKTDTPNT